MPECRQQLRTVK